MDFKFVVVRPFGGYLAGAVVSDANAMLAIQQGEHAHNVVRTVAAAVGAVAQAFADVAAAAAPSVKEG